MMNLKGKKLLILAASIHEADLVRRAKELGVYTIVTDYYSPERSPAKKIADEAWNISWSDIDELEKKCREHKVDGVTAGYSEFAVECLIKLCERLNLPCYSTMRQLDITRDKVKFKQVCRKNQVPVVKEYSCIEDVKEDPVIVKPVDRAGSIGISVATDKKSLIDAYNYAMEMSVCKNVIIEDFIYGQLKFDAFYSIIDGNITLLSSCDTINASNNGFEKVVQSAWVFPSKYHALFEETIDDSIRQMLKDMDIKNGYVFFSGFCDGKSFKFFETGFRLSGGHMYRYTSEKGLADIQDIFIYHALTGSALDVELGVDQKPNLKAVALNFYARKGVIDTDISVEQIKEVRTCKYAIPMAIKGQECTDDKAILTKLAMVHIYSENVDLLCEDVKTVNRLFQVKNTEGQDMIYDRIDCDVIREWWT